MLMNVQDTTTTWTGVKITRMLSQDIPDEERFTSILNETITPIFDPTRQVFGDRESMSFLDTLQNYANTLRTEFNGLIMLILPYTHQIYFIRSPILEEFSVISSSDPPSALC